MGKKTSFVENRANLRKHFKKQKGKKAKKGLYKLEFSR
jgi:hypothetical protein